MHIILMDGKEDDEGSHIEPRHHSLRIAEIGCALPKVFGITTGRRCYGQMGPKLNIVAIHTINMFGAKMECIQGEAPTFKYGSGSFKFWRFFAVSCPGARFKIKFTMISTKYQEILAENLVASDKNLSLGHRWIVQRLKAYIKINTAKQKPFSAMAISVSRLKSHEKV